jgi:hypothetical protein
MKKEKPEVRELAIRGFAQHAPKLGLTGDLLGTPIQLNGSTYKLVGLKLRLRTAPVVVESDDGTLYSLPLETILPTNG